MINTNELAKFDWFCDIGTDEFKRDVIYVHYMNIEIINYIQNKFGNVLIHFSSSLLKKDQYVILIDDIPDTDPDPYSSLMNEISDLQNTYNKNFLLDLFYEVHDGKNAVTNLSNIFPVPFQQMQKLYEIYGFDVLHEKLR